MTTDTTLEVEQVEFRGLTLYTIGDRGLLNDWSCPVAVVGARSCSDYGAHMARTLGRDLGERGITVVSGLARGVDGHAHRGCLDAGGKTIAVLGCGVDRPYPRAHAELYRQIVEKGGLIASEYPPGTMPEPWRFPARNRVVAAISVGGVVVVEARDQSGALITADYALELGRPLFAVPGEATSLLSKGTNDLLRREAKVCLSSEDVWPSS